jgi:hypothetical protein
MVLARTLLSTGKDYVSWGFPRTHMFFYFTVYKKFHSYILLLRQMHLCLTFILMHKGI